MVIELLRKPPFLLILVLVASLVGACENDLEYENDLDKSYEAWFNFQRSTDNSYRYLVSSSSWTGVRAETAISVKEGKVVQRSFTLLQLKGSAAGNQILDQWTEAESALNTHQTGAATLTLDQIYEKARRDWLLKRENVQTYFKAENQGMISYCGFVENGCADDCFNGITINSIEALK